MSGPVSVGEFSIGSGHPLVLIAGPCSLESEEIALSVAERISGVCERLDMPYVFKSSYLKDNRLAKDSYRGPGLEGGLEILDKVKKTLSVPTTTDVHTEEEAQIVSGVVDIVQIPALLSRQTRLIEAAARTGKPINIKKGQFMSPEHVVMSARKVEGEGNQQVILTERGSSFGYGNLVVDFRTFARLRQAGYPVVYDITHSLQLPGGEGEVSGGNPEFARSMGMAAVAAGCDAIFMEVHPKPSEALCDGSSMLTIERAEEVIEILWELGNWVRSHVRRS
jgi:2-dehydro-3-deoxyphosphooctonate aldolase (KDO 8-P synthase)